MNGISDWTNGIVAVYGRDNQPVGTGFVVSLGGLIVTCAHVLDLAGWPYRQWAAPVQVRFKATEGFAQAFAQEGRYQSQLDGDIAVLALAEQLPQGVEALPLWSADDTSGHTTYMWGYPKGFRNGLLGEGKVLGLVPDNRRQSIQLRSTETTRGYSGGPVWDQVWKRVTGMILRGIEADSMGRLPFTTFAVPAEALLDLLPEQLSLIPPDTPTAGAIHTLSEAMAMTFVDVVRMLAVTSGELAFTYNIERYDEFWEIGTDHMDDLRRQIARFTTILDRMSIADVNKIERLFNGLFSQLKMPPSEPTRNRKLLAKVNTLGENIHNFCMNANYTRYQDQFRIIEKEVARFLEHRPWERDKLDDLDTLWGIRLQIQSMILEKYQFSDERLTSIADDIVYDLAFVYFAIDYHLLPYSIK